MDADSSNGEGSVSKSQRKREAKALQALGRRLIDLKAAQLDLLPLPANLREAIGAAQRITQQIARKREMQYVGKLLRELDVAPIEAALARLEAPGLAERARHRRVEQWRDALIAGGDPTIQQLVAVEPGADRSQLRRLVLAARREEDAGRPPAAARQLFRLLRELDAVAELPEAPPPP